MTDYQPFEYGASFEDVGVLLNGFSYGNFSGAVVFDDLGRVERLEIEGNVRGAPNYVMIDGSLFCDPPDNSHGARGQIILLHKLLARHLSAELQRIYAADIEHARQEWRAYHGRSAA